MEDGQVVLVNFAQIVALYEVGRETRFVLSSADDFYVDLPERKFVRKSRTQHGN
jgi:hypothetical protein